MLRLCFPTVVANASPLSVLPQFVEVLGKKLDKITSELDPSNLKSTETFFLNSMLVGRSVKASCRIAFEWLALPLQKCFSIRSMACARWVYHPFHHEYP